MNFDETDISPPQYFGHLQRTRLVSEIEFEARKLTLLQSPPGYGKTALMSQLFHARPECSVWLNIRESDNDPVSLLQKFGSALMSIDAVNGKHILPHFDGFTPPSLTPWVRSLINDINGLEQIRLFINDSDLLSDTRAIEILNALLQYSGHQVRLYISTTKTPQFSYAHLLLENQMKKITTSELRFGHDEIVASFSLKSGLTLNENSVAQLAGLTEGWPTALYFAANSLRSELDLQHFLRELADGPQAFDRYFFEKIFERLSHATQCLLMRLSLLDCFTVDLCRALSDNAEAANTVIDFIRQQAFISPMDASGQWIRFQYLFSAFLRKQMALELTAEEQSQARLLAGRCLKGAGRIEDAIEFALKAGAHAQAAEWIEEALPTTVVRHGRHVTYLHWLKHLPEEVLRVHPRIRLGHIVSLTMGRQILAAAEQIALIHQFRSSYDEEVNRELDRTTDLVFCCCKALQDEAHLAEPQITRWLDQWNDIRHYHQPNDFHYELGFAWLVKGYCAKCRSAFPVAQNALTQAHNHFQAYGSPWGQAWVRSMLTVNYARQGFHYEALQEATEAYKLVQENLGEKSHPGCGLAALIAAIHYEIDELGAAEHYVQDTLEPLKEQSATDLLIAAFETRARLMMHAGAVEEGLGFLKDGIKWAESQSLERLKLRLVDELIVWLIRHRRALEVERYASHFDLLQRTAHDFKSNISTYHTTARCRVYLLIERNAPKEALELLDLLIERGSRLKHQRRCAEWYKLAAIAHSRAKAPEKALEALAQALEMSATQNYFRLFLDDEPMLANMLAKIAAQPGKKTYDGFLAQLQKKLQPNTRHVKIVEPLTAKEIEILRFLEGGMSNKQIAEQLFVSEGTLKWHLHNIYSKLQTKNRTQAILAARKYQYL